MALVAMAAGAPAQELSALPPSVSKLLQAAGLPLSALGVLVMRTDATSGAAPLLAFNATQPMPPASTIKVLTAAVGLETLGPLYRGRAELLSLGTPQNGVLSAPLLLRGLGSPDLDVRAFTTLLQQLREGRVGAGGQRTSLTHLAGDLVIDRLHYAPARPDLAMPPFDSTPEFRYNVIPDALSLNMNLVRIEMRSSLQTVSAVLNPSLDGVQVQANFAMNDFACKDWEDAWQLPTVAKGSDGQITISLSGGFPKNCDAATEVNVLDRTDYADRLFRTLWRGLGGTYSGQTREAAQSERTREMPKTPGLAENAARDANSATGATSGSATSAPAMPKVLATHLSRPLSEFMRDINKRSDNPTTRMLFLALAKGVAPEGSAATGAATGAGAGVSGSLAGQTSVLGAENAILNIANNGVDVGQSAKNVVFSWFKAKKIDSEGLVLDNGSGLSRSERITPLQLALVLQAAHAGPWAPEFLASLPIVGLDGSMRNRLKTGPAAQRARIKTGGLRDVGSVAGYVQNANGQTLVVVGMLNHPLATRRVTGPILDALLEWAAQTTP